MSWPCSQQMGVPLTMTPSGVRFAFLLPFSTCQETCYTCEPLVFKGRNINVKWLRRMPGSKPVSWGLRCNRHAWECTQGKANIARLVMGMVTFLFVWTYSIRHVFYVYAHLCACILCCTCACTLTLIFVWLHCTMYMYVSLFLRVYSYTCACTVTLIFVWLHCAMYMYVSLSVRVYSVTHVHVPSHSSLYASLPLPSAVPRATSVLMTLMMPMPSLSLLPSPPMIWIRYYL